MTADYRPTYLELYESGELEKRVQALEKLLLSCTVCPLDCGNNRLENQPARCFSGRRVNAGSRAAWVSRTGAAP